MSDTSDEFDAPETADVLQDTTDYRNVPPVLVEISGSVRTDEMPSRLGVIQNFVLKAGAQPEKILNGDPRRRTAILWAFALAGGVEAVCISNNPEDARNFKGAMMHPGTGLLRYELSVQDELWARPCVINETAGVFSSFGVSTADCLLSVVGEMWSR